VAKLLSDVSSCRDSGNTVCHFGSHEENTGKEKEDKEKKMG